jgi:pimeloyl-ACP methyl ester carboxylesterase
MTPIRTLMLACAAALLWQAAPGPAPVAAQEPSDPGMGAKTPGPLKGLVRKGYVDSTTGQIHYRIVTPATATKTPIVFLPPNPSTSLYFAYMMEDLGNDRVAMAFDLPGYGASDRPKAPPTMQDYGRAIATALENLGHGPRGRGPVDVAGYHTGAYVTIELLASRPDLVRRGVLIGVPFWEGEKLARMRKQLVDEPGPHEGVHEDGSHVEAHWKSSVAGRNPFLPLERANELFIERLRGGSTAWWGYAADVNYDARTALTSIRQPVLVLNTHGGLHAETAAAAALIPNATLVDVPELTTAIFDVGHELLSGKMRAWLDR